MALLALITLALLATLHCIVLLTLSVSIELVSSSARVTSVKYSNGDHLPELPGVKDVHEHVQPLHAEITICLLYTSPSPRDS